MKSNVWKIFHRSPLLFVKKIHARKQFHLMYRSFFVFFCITGEYIFWGGGRSTFFARFTLRVYFFCISADDAAAGWLLLMVVLLLTLPCCCCWLLASWCWLLLVVHHHHHHHHHQHQIATRNKKKNEPIWARRKAPSFHITFGLTRQRVFTSHSKL